jgi:hypothetical protein
MKVGVEGKNYNYKKLEAYNEDNNAYKTKASHEPNGIVF